MKTLLMDLDGTMYRGKEPIEAAIRFIRRAQKKGVPVLFLTNNAMRTPQENMEHMEAMGYEGIDPGQFYNSSMAAARYVQKHYQGRRAWYIGQQGLRQALLDHGFTITESDPDFVFVGMDTRADYRLYSQGLDYLLNGARLIGTNEDRVLANGPRFDIGNGAVVHMLEYASGQTSPKIGKPHAWILEACLEAHGLDRDEVILVGDNLETDIALGYNNQVKTVLVESGVHTRKDIDRLKIYPDRILSSLDEFDLDTLEEF